MSVPDKTIVAAMKAAELDALTADVATMRRAGAWHAVEAAMDPALGPDRLVVAGPHEQHVIHQIVAWLDNEAERAFVQDRTDSGLVLRNVAEKIALEFEMDPAIGNGIEDDYR